MVLISRFTSYKRTLGKPSEFVEFKNGRCEIFDKSLIELVKNDSEFNRDYWEIKEGSEAPTPEKPLSQMNKEELLAKAKSLDVEVIPEDTNSQLRLKITSKLESLEG